MNGFFKCSNNKLTNLAGLPEYVGFHFIGFPNLNLLDISDIWSSDIEGLIRLGIILNPEMAILPLIKFKIIDCPVDIADLRQRNQGASKQNIIDFQFDLIENGYEKHAKWKP